jgi:exodeoxyribonuclease VII small subunit
MSEKQASFEQAVSELEHIVAQMERGDISLEESLEKFERGISLVRSSQQQLLKAEQKVKILMASDSQSELEPFNQEISDGSAQNEPTPF